MEIINSHKAVQEQYKTANNLNTRISIHAKYSTNKLGFGNWLFSHYDIPSDIEILELGCGTGNIWKSNLHVLDTGVQLLLTDFSEGMVSEVKKTFEACSNISYNIVNIENIPYENNRFDRVIANMMLYHVPDLHKGLSEVQRVLAGDGYFYCATYGENGIVPFIVGLLKEYGAKDVTNKNFTLQNGYEILKKYFSDVQRLDYEDSLAVTNIDDILDYLYSLTSITSIADLKRKDLKEILEGKMVNNILSIPKEYGMFICRK